MFKLRMAEGKLQLWIKLVVFMVGFLRIEGLFVETTYLKSALEKGAVCLDGSPPAYNLHRGYGTGIDSWLVHIEGGGWCSNVTTCLRRKNTRLGSSLKMDKKLAFSGIMSNKAKFNPDFYNWNRVKIRYCDGASFTGDVEEVDPYTKLHYRGARIWLAVIEDLLSKGMKDAENAILSGCSAGGLTSILHCDSFRALLPMGTKVKCLSDAGYFINVDDLTGEPRIASYFKDTMKLHGSKRNLPASCTTDSEAHLCFFPQYVAPKIQTPLFILNAAYDSWQIRNIVAPTVADPHSYWNGCRTDIEKCTLKQLKVMQEFRLEFIEAMRKVNRQSTGLFINSCYAHCQTEMQETWYAQDSPVLNKTTIAEAIGDWFYDQNPFQRIDCPYPCDRSCHNRIFDPQEHQII